MNITSVLTTLTTLVLFASCTTKQGVFHIKNDKDERYLCKNLVPNLTVGSKLELGAPYEVDGYEEGTWYNYRTVNGYKFRAMPFKVDSFENVEWNFLTNNYTVHVYKYIGTCNDR